MSKKFHLLGDCFYVLEVACASLGGRLRRLASPHRKTAPGRLRRRYVPACQQPLPVMPATSKHAATRVAQARGRPPLQPRRRSSLRSWRLVVRSAAATARRRCFRGRDLASQWALWLGRRVVVDRQQLVLRPTTEGGGWWSAMATALRALSLLLLLLLLDFPRAYHSTRD